MPPTPAKSHPLDEFLTPISNAVFRHEKARQDAIAEDLINRNLDAGGSAKAFVCAGRTVSQLSPKELKGYHPRPVVPELHDEALIFVEAANKLDYDKRKLDQYCGSLFRRCRGIQDVRNLLPDMLVAEISVFKAISRTAEPTFLLKENAMLQIPFQGLQDTIGYYLANRLIF